MLTDVHLALGTRRSRYQTPYLEGVENRTHLVAREFYPLLQEPFIDYGALERAPRALPLLADDLAHLLGQFSSVVSISHEHTINREGLWAKSSCERGSLRGRLNFREGTLSKGECIEATRPLTLLGAISLVS